MESRNPVFRRSEEFSRSGGYATFDTRTPSAGELQDLYEGPPAGPLQTGRMTLDDVVMRTATLFGVLLVSAAAVWIPVMSSLSRTETIPGWATAATFGGAIVGLVLSLVISFGKTIRPPLILAYAVAEGLFVGGLSAVFEAVYPGIVVQAVIGTLGAFTAMLLLYRTGVIRATPRFRKMLLIAGVGYMVFLLVNLVSSWAFGFSAFFDTGALGALIGGFGVALASLFLVLDFDQVEQGIRNGAPQQFAWMAAFGLLVTLVWLYIEILRLLAILREFGD